MSLKLEKKLNLMAVSVSPAVLSRLKHYTGQVFSVHRHVVNMIGADSRIVALTDSTIGNTPNGVVINSGTDFRQINLKRDAAISADGCTLELGRVLSVDLRTAKKWSPEIRHSSDISPGGLINNRDQLLKLLRKWGKVGGIVGILGDMKTEGSFEQAVIANVRQPLEELLDSIAKDSLAEIPGLVGQLSGLGAGSTPAVDDCLAGIMVTLKAAAAGKGILALAMQSVRINDVNRLIVETSWERTTFFARELLSSAAEGEAAEKWEPLVVNALSGNADFQQALLESIAVGGTSGTDFAVGVYLAMRVLSQLLAA